MLLVVSTSVWFCVLGIFLLLGSCVPRLLFFEGLLLCMLSSVLLPWSHLVFPFVLAGPYCQVSKHGEQQEVSSEKVFVLFAICAEES